MQPLKKKLLAKHSFLKNLPDVIDPDNILGINYYLEVWQQPDSGYHKTDKADYGINAIKAAIAVFGKENVRAYIGGIPNVWLSGGSVDKDKVKDLLSPSRYNKHSI